MLRLSLLATPLCLAALGLAACGDRADAPTVAEASTPASAAPVTMPDSAVAALSSAGGAAAGTATATATADGGVMIAVRGQGLPVGEHGIHVHMTGRCDGPAFDSAGGHWNPTAAQHGLDNPLGQHAGDMPNMTVAADGAGSLDYMLKDATVQGLLDADGSAFIVHASPDDQKTDPSGASGSRIACGVFAAG